MNRRIAEKEWLSRYPSQGFLFRAYSPISHLRCKNGGEMTFRLISINTYLHMNSDFKKKKKKAKCSNSTSIPIWTDAACVTGKIWAAGMFYVGLRHFYLIVFIFGASRWTCPQLHSHITLHGSKWLGGKSLKFPRYFSQGLMLDFQTKMPVNIGLKFPRRPKITPMGRSSCFLSRCVG